MSRRKLLTGRSRSLTGPQGEEMNAVLEEQPQPFFMTLFAGERIDEGFGAEVQSWIQDLSSDQAGIVVESLYSGSGTGGDDRGYTGQREAHGRGPVVWRQEAVIEAGGFASRDELPFDGYVLHEAMNRLARHWSWKAVSTSSWCNPFLSKPAAWRREGEKWQRILPLLAPPALDTSSSNPSSPSTLSNPCDVRFSIVICTCNDARTIMWAIRSVWSSRSRAGSC